VYPLTMDEHLLVLLGAVGDLARELAFDRTSALELDLVVRELGSNALRHGGGGRASIAATPLLGSVSDAGVRGRTGIEVVIADDGPGIPDIEAALVDGFSTGRGLGVGLGAAQRLSDSLTIDSRLGSGTRVRVIKWARKAS
jgi:serine/threonine-protein kinase RsbT